MAGGAKRGKHKKHGKSNQPVKLKPTVKTPPVDTNPIPAAEPAEDAVISEPLTETVEVIDTPKPSMDTDSIPAAETLEKPEADSVPAVETVAKPDADSVPTAEPVAVNPPIEAVVMQPAEPIVKPAEPVPPSPGAVSVPEPSAEKTVPAGEPAPPENGRAKEPAPVGMDAAWESRPDESLRASLAVLLKQHGRGLFQDPAKLESELLAMGWDAVTVYRVCLMTRVSGFPRLLDPTPQAEQYDVERFVRNALRETGFHRRLVLELTAAFAALSDTAFREKPAKNGENGVPADPDGIPPAFTAVREEDVAGCERALRAWLDRGEPVSGEILSRLRRLSAAGVPEARYYMGEYLLRKGREGLSPGDDSLPLRLLNEAASAGEPRAAAALGDYYYNRRGPGDWGRAYDCYTGYGSLALNRRRRSALTDLLNRKVLNRNLLACSGILLAVLAMFTLLAPGAPLYPRHDALGAVFLLAAGGLMAAAVRRYRRSPYGDYYGLPVALLASWTALLVLRLLW